MKLLSSYAVNGILSMQQIKKKNLRMLKYLQGNLGRLSLLLADEDIIVLNDINPISAPGAIQAYLKLHFGTRVNLTELRVNHRSVYRAISSLGRPRMQLLIWGFDPHYSKVFTEDMLIAHLRKLACSKEPVILYKTHRDLYNKVLYRSSLRGMSAPEYLIWTGLKTLAPAKIDTSEILRLRDGMKMSFRQIAAALGIGKSTVEKYYKKNCLL